ncbi:MAG: glycosyltransferase family 4 protein [Acidimicrobiales bacterium]
MRILFVTDFYHPFIGGVEIHVRTLAHALVERGHEVAVATLPTSGDTPQRTEDGPVTVFTVGHLAQRVGARFSHVDRPWAPPFPDPLSVKDLRAAVKEFAPDVIHGHDWLARSAQPGLVSRDIPFVTTLHYYTRGCAKKTMWRDGAICEGPALRRCLSCASDHYGAVRGVAVTLGIRAAGLLENRRTDRWISVSAATESLSGLGDDPSATVIYNPVPSVQGPPAEETPLPPELEGQPFMLFVGDIRPEKGVSVLAEAVTLMRAGGNHTPLVIVGERMSSEITLPPGTFELGPVPNPVVKALWSKATIGVVPSLWPEPFGLVAIEAMEAGCALVASDVGGLSEILGEDRGSLVPPGDADALATAMIDLLADGELRQRRSASALVSMERFAVDKIIDQIEAEYHQVVSPS